MNKIITFNVKSLGHLTGGILTRLQYLLDVEKSESYSFKRLEQGFTHWITNYKIVSNPVAVKDLMRTSGKYYE